MCHSAYIAVDMKWFDRAQIAGCVLTLCLSYFILDLQLKNAIEIYEI